MCVYACGVNVEVYEFNFKHQRHILTVRVTNDVRNFIHNFCCGRFLVNRHESKIKRKTKIEEPFAIYTLNESTTGCLLRIYFFLDALQAVYADFAILIFYAFQTLLFGSWNKKNECEASCLKQENDRHICSSSNL